MQRTPPPLPTREAAKTPATPPDLEYGPPLPFRRRKLYRRGRMWLPFGGLLLAVFGWVMVQGRVLYFYARCVHYFPTPTEVVYDDDANQARRLISTQGYARLPSINAAPQGSVPAVKEFRPVPALHGGYRALFLHGRSPPRRAAKDAGRRSCRLHQGARRVRAVDQHPHHDPAIGRPIHGDGADRRVWLQDDRAPPQTAGLVHQARKGTWPDVRPTAA